MRILLVEDDPATSRSIELMLTHANFNVYCTDLGEDGVDLAKLYDYDLILLDLNLPDMSGHDVLRQIRQARVVPDVEHDIVEAVRRTMRGQSVSSARAARAWCARPTPPGGRQAPAAPSPGWTCPLRWARPRHRDCRDGPAAPSAGWQARGPGPAGR